MTLTFRYCRLLVISLEVSRSILEIYFKGLEDYSIDHRGDVGSWVREACMQGLAEMAPLVGQLDLSSDEMSERYLSEEDHNQVLAKLLQQSVEKIDKMRASAAAAIIKIIYARTESSTQEEPQYVVHVPHRVQLMDVFQDSVELNWLQASEVYIRVVHLLNLPEFRSDLLLGFIISAGGMTETLVGFFPLGSFVYFLSIFPYLHSSNPSLQFRSAMLVLVFPSSCRTSQLPTVIWRSMVPQPTF